MRRRTAEKLFGVLWSKKCKFGIWQSIFDRTSLIGRKESPKKCNEITFYPDV